MKGFCTTISPYNKLKQLPNLLSIMGAVPAQGKNEVNRKGTEAWRAETSKTSPSCPYRGKTPSICSIHLPHVTCNRANLSRNRPITAWILGLNANVPYQYPGSQSYTHCSLPSKGFCLYLLTNQGDFYVTLSTYKNYVLKYKN